MAAAWSAFWPSGPGLWGPPLGNWVLPASLPERTSHSAWPTRKWEAHEFQKDCSRPLRKLMGKQDCSHLSLAGWFQKHQTTGLWLYNKNNSCDCSLSFFWMNIFSMLSPVLVFMCITFFNCHSSWAWEGEDLTFSAFLSAQPSSTSSFSSPRSCSSCAHNDLDHASQSTTYSYN